MVVCYVCPWCGVVQVGTAVVLSSLVEGLSPLVWATVFVPRLPVACLVCRVVAEGHVSLSVVGCVHLGVAGSHGWTGLTIQCVALLIVALFVSISDGSSEVSFNYVGSIYFGHGYQDWVRKAFVFFTRGGYLRSVLILRSQVAAVALVVQLGVYPSLP